MTRFWVPRERLVDRGVLAGEADLAADRRGVADDVVARDARGAAVGAQERGEDADGGRLAGAVRAQHAEHRAACRGEVDAVERDRRAEALGEPGGLDGEVVRSGHAGRVGGGARSALARRSHGARGRGPSLDGMSSPTRLAGVDVPRVGLGTNRLTTASEHVAFVREAVAAGVRHIDTAHLYTGGESEQAIAAALDGAAEDVLVATKGGYRSGEGRPALLRAQIEQSLRALRTDAIGLYYLHRIDPETPLEESLGEIKAFVDRGAIRHVGISEVTVAQIEAARAVVPIAAVQNKYNLAERGTTTSSTTASARASRSFPTTRSAATAGRPWVPPPSVSA